MSSPSPCISGAAYANSISSSSPSALIANLNIIQSAIIKALFIILLLVFLIRFCFIFLRHRHYDRNSIIAYPTVQNNVVVVSLGLDHNIIDSYPCFLYSKALTSGTNSDTECPICICEYEESDMLRMMPQCRHRFHLDCLDAWLKINGSCPVCRNSPLLQLAPPLSHNNAANPS